MFKGLDGGGSSGRGLREGKRVEGGGVGVKWQVLGEEGEEFQPA